MNTPTLTLTRGLPGCGKSTWAAEQVAADPVRTVRVGRDPLRAMFLPGVRWPHGDDTAEAACTVGQLALIAALLDAGHNVICDDTNLDPQHVAVLTELAHDCGARVRIHDMTDVPIEVCITRDAARWDGSRVGADVIRALAVEFLEPQL